MGCVNMPKSLITQIPADKTREPSEIIRNPWRSQSPVSSGTSSSSQSISRYVLTRPMSRGKAERREIAHLATRHHLKIIPSHQIVPHPSHHYPIPYYQGYPHPTISEGLEHGYTPHGVCRDSPILRPASSPVPLRSTQASDSPSRPPSCHYYCSYFLQAIFICGIMAGTSIAIAGAVYHNQRGKLLVLVYIGALVAIVCFVLLVIQCCDSANSNNGTLSISHSSSFKSTSSKLRRPNEGATPECIPLQTFGQPTPQDMESTFISHRYDCPSERGSDLVNYPRHPRQIEQTII